MEGSFFNPFQLVVATVAIVASMLVFGQLLLRRDTNRWAMWLLALFMLLNGVMNLMFILVDSGLILRFWYLFRVTVPFNYIMAAMMYLYLRAMIEDDSGPKKTDWYHGIPFIVAIVNYLPFYLSSADEKKAKLEAVVQDYAVYVQGQDGWLPEDIMIGLRMTLLLVYIPFYFRLIRKHYTLINESNRFDRLLHRWLWILTSSVSIYFLSVCVFLLTQLLPASVQNNPQYLLYLVGLSRFVEIFWTSSFVFMSVYQVLVPSVGIGQFQSDSVSSLMPGEKKRKGGTPNDDTSDSSTESYAHPDLKKLVSFFEEDRIWKHSDVKLQSLAHQLGFSQRKTSYLVNKFLGGNFNQVVNRYRIEHAKELIAQGYLSKHSVEGLWKECGFSNHTTFYQGFKKHTGKTPSEYEKQVLGLV